MRKKMKWLQWILLPLIQAACPSLSKSDQKAETPKGAVIYACIFAKDGWKKEDWINVKSPRWDYFGEWVQDHGCIRNECPAGADEKEIESKRAGETYSSMLYKNKVGADVTISATMDFAYRMAPLIVITPEFGKDDKGRNEHREHYEIVLFDRGVNIWHYYYENGKSFYKKAAYSSFPLEKNRKYTLTVSIKKVKREGVVDGKELAVTVDGKHEFGYLDDHFPDEFYVGLTGCEGVNHFYDFEILASHRK